MKLLIKPIPIIVLLSAILVAVFSFIEIDLASIGDPIRETFSNGVNKFLALAQEIAPDESYFFPTYPQRLTYLAAEISQSGEELAALNEGLVNETKKCDCKFALSQCLKKGLGIFSACQPGALNVFGDPCPNREEIEKKQSEIKEKNDQISHLRNLLQKEMETGLERELKTLRPEVAQELRNNLSEILEKSKNIISPAETNLGLLKVKSTGNCSASCELGPICGVRFCVMLGTGEQKPINLKFKVGVGLEDLKLGQIGIKNINLGLPEKIQLPKLDNLVVTIPAQQVVIAFPQKTLAELDLSSQSISLSSQISLPQAPEINLSCPKLSFLKIPTLPSLPELPAKIVIPSFKIPETKFCPKLPALPKTSFLEAPEKIEDVVKKFEDEIKTIEEKIKTITDTKESNKQKKQTEETKEEIKKVKQGIKTPEVKTPGIELSTPETSKEKEVKIPETKTPKTELPQSGLSSSYQCSLDSSNGKVESTESSWYFQILSWLMEQCQKLPAMTGPLGLKTGAAECFNPEKLPSFITKSCSETWPTYCAGEAPPAEYSQSCKETQYICSQNGNSAAAAQCQNLFNQEKETVPSSCKYEIDFEGNYVSPPDFNPVETLKNKCQQLKDKGRKEPPEPCKVLPLFVGKIEAPYSELYSTSKVSCPAQKIGDFPSGFGGVGLNCPLALPTLPKISLPKIIIPDIIMPEFSIMPFVKIKLPSFIFEDLILPDIDLCNLDDCQNIFPDLNFQWPSLNLPSLSPSLRMPPLDIPFKVPMPEIKVAIRLPSIAFKIPSLNLLNLMLPEIELPEIPLPKPKIIFAFSGIDLSAIWDYIITFILNALGIPDYSLCISLKMPFIPLVIAYPDYYISWIDFPKIPEIPFCKDIRSFCQNLKTSLKEVTKKVGEIEKVFNQTVLKIQAKLNLAAQVINQELTNRINGILKEYAGIIKEKVQEHLEMVHAHIEDYIDPKTGELKIPPLPIRLPERKINLPLSKMIGLPEEITIPWPEKLKKIILTKSLTYNLPTIPLNKLSYIKEMGVKGPGFQSRTLTVDLGNLGGSGDCLSNSPTGGNPLPVSQFQSNLGNIISIQAEIQGTSKKIINILE